MHTTTTAHPTTRLPHLAQGVADVPVEGTDTEASDQVRPPCQGGREVR